MRRTNLRWRPKRCDALAKLYRIEEEIRGRLPDERREVRQARSRPLDGRIEIDNNAAERALRVVALGRKNYLFSGSDRGGERAATIYSLLGTPKLNDLDPERYLREVLSRIADHPVNRITASRNRGTEELLPWNLVPGSRNLLR